MCYHYRQPTRMAQKRALQTRAFLSQITMQTDWRAVLVFRRVGSLIQQKSVPRISAKSSNAGFYLSDSRSSAALFSFQSSRTAAIEVPLGVFGLAPLTHNRLRPTFTAPIK